MKSLHVVYDNVASAREGLTELARSGLLHEGRASIHDNPRSVRGGVPLSETNAGLGALLGGAIIGIWCMAIGAIVGWADPELPLGPTTGIGLAFGIIYGALIGAFVGSAAPKASVREVERAVQQGHAALTARFDDDEEARQAEQLLLSTRGAMLPA